MNRRTGPTRFADCRRAAARSSGRRSVTAYGDALLASLLALSLCACGKQTFLAAAFVQTPALPAPPGAKTDIPAYAVLTAYLGTIDTTDPTKIDASKVAGVPGATAQVYFHSVLNSADAVLPVPDQKDGEYLLTSKDNGNLTFEQAVPYTLVMTTPGDSAEAFGARFTPGPPAGIKEFPAGSPYLEQKALAQDFTVTRSDAPGSDGRLAPAFYLVAKLDPNNLSAQPVITDSNIPKDATSLLKYVLSDAPYRVPNYTINGAKAFADAGYYVVALLAIQQGKVSENAFLGSTALTGTGAAGVLKVGQ